jgi:phage repressor protein C with HTH and peptisase S24 domain
MENLAQRLKRAMSARGMTRKKDLAEMAGVSSPAVTQWLNGTTSDLSANALYALAKGLRVRAGWLKDGTGPMEDRENPVIPDESFSSFRPILTWEHPDDLPSGDYIFVPRLDVRLSAGAGEEQLQIEFIKDQPQAFRAEWVRRAGLKPNKLACMKAHGDSMEGHIYDGDDLLIDTSQTEVLDGKVYALWYDGGERVKRLFRLPGGGLIVKSDNESRYPQFVLAGDEVNRVRIIGRVVLKSGMGGL